MLHGAAAMAHKLLCKVGMAQAESKAHESNEWST
jgi:hypothetical protein